MNAYKRDRHRKDLKLVLPIVQALRTACHE